MGHYNEEDARGSAARMRERKGLVVIAAFFAASLLLACGQDPHSVVVPNDPTKADNGNFSNAVKGLPQDEKELLAKYFLRTKLKEALGGGTGVPPGTTVSDALRSQREFDTHQIATATAVAQQNAEAAAKAQVLKDQLTQEKARLIAAFSKSLVVTLIDTKYVPANSSRFQFSDEAQVTIGVQNSGDKGVQTFKGTIRLKDQFDQEIESAAWTYDKPLAPGATGTLVWTPNTFGNGRRLKDLSIEQLKFTFEPLSIIYADGSRLDMPD